MTLVIACATVIEEMLPLLPPDVGHRVLDFGLHTDPAKLRQTLQQTIDEVDPAVDTIILGYGLCSQGVIGLRSAHARLVVPRGHDPAYPSFSGPAPLIANRQRRSQAPITSRKAGSR